MTRSSIWDVDRDRFPAPPTRIIPRAVCSSCRRFFSTPITALPIPCYWCHAGEFTAREFWTFVWCPACDGCDPFCKRCHGTRIIATPISTEPPASARP